MDALTLTQYNESQLKTIFYVAVKEALNEFKDEIKAANKPDELLTRQQVAEMLGVTLTTLWHYDNKNVLNPVRIGSKVRYRRSDVEKALKGRE